jgi:hypothetical protein
VSVFSRPFMSYTSETDRPSCVSEKKWNDDLRARSKFDTQGEENRGDRCARKSTIRSHEYMLGSMRPFSCSGSVLSPLRYLVCSLRAAKSASLSPGICLGGVLPLLNRVTSWPRSLSSVTRIICKQKRLETLPEFFALPRMEATKWDDENRVCVHDKIYKKIHDRLTLPQVGAGDCRENTAQSRRGEKVE